MQETGTSRPTPVAPHGGAPTGRVSRLGGEGAAGHRTISLPGPDAPRGGTREPPRRRGRGRSRRARPPMSAASAPDEAEGITSARPCTTSTGRPPSAESRSSRACGATSTADAAAESIATGVSASATSGGARKSATRCVKRVCRASSPASSSRAAAGARRARGATTSGRASASRMCSGRVAPGLRRRMAAAPPERRGLRAIGARESGGTRPLAFERVDRCGKDAR